MKVKTFLKSVLIFILIVTAIGGTVYLFFKNKQKMDNTTSSVAVFLESDAKKDFDNNLVGFTTERVFNLDLRFIQLSATNKKLNQATEALIGYYINSNTKISNKAVASTFKDVKASVDIINKMFEEYEIKSTSPYFSSSLGANDLMSALSKYLLQYAKFVDLINKDVSGINKNADVKFAMIDLYVRVVSSTFNSITVNSYKLNTISDLSNIKLMNSYFEIKNSYLVIDDDVDKFSSLTNLFITNYNACNQATLVSRFSESVDSLSVITESSTDEQRAIYYFKQIYKIG